MFVDITITTQPHRSFLRCKLKYSKRINILIVAATESDCYTDWSRCVMWCDELSCPDKEIGSRYHSQKTSLLCNPCFCSNSCLMGHHQRHNLLHNTLIMTPYLPWLMKFEMPPWSPYMKITLGQDRKPWGSINNAFSNMHSASLFYNVNEG